MKVQIVNDGPNNTTNWKALISSNPVQVVCSLTLSSGGKPREPDIVLAEVFPALEAVVDAAKSSGKKWKRLVEAGVVEALCNNVLEMKATFHHLLNMLSLDELEKVTQVYLCNSSFILWILTKPYVDEVIILQAAGGLLHRDCQLD